MADQATETTIIEAPPERCFGVAIDFEHYPEWADNVKEAKVVSRDEEGRPLDVAFRAAAVGRTARYVLRYDYADAPQRLSWRLVEGDIMRRLDGNYEFVDAGDGATDVTYRLAVDLVVPLPSFIKRRVEGIILGTALRSLKKRAEALA